MPPVNKHCQICLARRGRDFRDLHQWMDNDPEQKAARHDLTKVYALGDEAERLFGPEAREELLLHLLDDLKAKVGHALPEGSPTLAEAVAGALAQVGIK